jgi:hypothetical protein
MNTERSSVFLAILSRSSRADKTSLYYLFYRTDQGHRLYVVVKRWMARVFSSLLIPVEGIQIKNLNS